MGERAIVWLRRDLRLHDHRPLAEATRRYPSVAAAFVFDTRILDRLQDRDDRRVTFFHRSLAELDRGLRRHGSRLVALHGDPTLELPRLAERWGASAVFAGRDSDPYAVERDAEVARRLSGFGCELRLVKDHVVLEAPEVTAPDGGAYRVFTPFSKAWLARVRPEDTEEQTPDLTRLAPAASLEGLGLEDWSLERLGFEEAPVPIEAGEQAALRAFERFLDRIDRYGELRDFPASDGVSGLSPHFRFGTLSIRLAAREAMARGSEGARKWLTELVWREFYQAILWRFPHVVNSSFRPEYDALVWPGGDEEFHAWAEGRTGYPIVDAAMRCLRQTGQMHNRLRMVAASFLTKDLLVDWRRGEAWFARWLLDYELASNNGGWQWAASTGCDAQPYFRIFNPVLQSRKFDPQGAFLRRWCPELAGFSDERIHAPWEASPLEQELAGCRIGSDYPAPVVDHQTQKARAVALLSSVASRGS